MRPLIHGGDIYTPRDTEEPLCDFSANINPLGMPPEVQRAIVEHIPDYAAYPDPLCRDLRGALADHHQLDAANIVCGNGAADLIFRLVLARRPRRALVLAPTFAEYAQALALVGCSVEHYPLKRARDFALDEGILAAIEPGLDMLFLCNPNNPTGMPADPALLQQVLQRCRRCGVLLVVDECFVDFMAEEARYSLCPQLQNQPQLCILRAFTKMYAMAGVRLGYLLCGRPALAEQIRATGQPWSVSTVAAVSGIAALKCQQHRRQTVLLVEKNRWLLTEGLRRLGFTVYPSMANYLLFSAGDTQLAFKLAQRGILIRDCRNYEGLQPGDYRVAVRGESDCRRLLAALHQEVKR